MYVRACISPALEFVREIRILVSSCAWLRSQVQVVSHWKIYPNTDFRRNDEVLSLLDGEGMKLRYGRVDFKISPRLVESWLAIHPRIRLRCLAEEQVVGDRFNFLARILLSTRGEKRRKKGREISLSPPAWK